MAGMKGRSGGRRPGAGRPRGSKNSATKERDEFLGFISRSLRTLLHQAEAEKQVRMNQYESGPLILKRLTEIERKLGLREQVTRPPRYSRSQPLGRSEAAERLFRER